ncbi:hypothetical protein [Nitrosomonas aestuarii]|uniref:hypothetical protein n=1 Tax=Nitrosomonas aestuarii TaxID=52441 RepID=UPI000D2F54C3|nr:hypothetical protein [Nitrosomonas aestuarii]PTN08440.1 hypothetical protein C8R11_12819 [Nitrosomonas aestuarii]
MKGLLVRVQGRMFRFSRLKLFTNAREEQFGGNETKWSPALVQLFMNKQGQCDQWPELMVEPEFSAGDYWKRDGG